MNRLWSRVGVRATSVGLLVVGVIGGVYVGHDREVQVQGAQSQHVVQAGVDEIALLKSRQSEHAAARAWQREAEGDAAAKAAAEAKAAAGKARSLEKKAIAKKADKKAANAKKTKPSGATVPYTGPIPTSCKSYVGSRGIGCALMLHNGFAIDQFPCLDKLFARESGWNYKASNAGSGAYGIPQALPGSKMASEGADWKTSPATQIKWGLKYIEGRYNSPCGAWSHSQNTGWY